MKDFVVASARIGQPISAKRLARHIECKCPKRNKKLSARVSRRGVEISRYEGAAPGDPG
jgi:hypothetical protein